MEFKVEYNVFKLNEHGLLNGVKPIKMKEKIDVKIDETDSETDIQVRIKNLIREKNPNAKLEIVSLKKCE